MIYLLKRLSFGSDQVSNVFTENSQSPIKTVTLIIERSSTKQTMYVKSIVLTNCRQH